MHEVKRYDAVHLRYEDSNIRYGEGCEVEVVTASDYAAIEAELARLRAGQEPVAYITGYHGGRCIIEPVNRAAVLPSGMALYTAPQPSAVPEGESEALEVVAYMKLNSPIKNHTDFMRHETWMNDGLSDGWVSLVRLSDHLRAIAELREECEASESQAEYQRGRADHFMAERDTLRQQLAEWDAEIERLRMQLVACGVVALANTPKSASEARQMHQDYMSASCSDVANAVDREMTLRQQCDKLAGLLREAKSAYTTAIHWEDMRAAMAQIDAALS